MKQIILRETDPFYRFVEYCDYVLEGGYKFEDKEKIKALIQAYVSGNGLAVFGNPGSGKTFLFQVLQKITPPNEPHFFSLVESTDLVSIYNGSGDEVFKKHDCKNICINDFGFERIGVHYGDKVEVMEQLLHVRDELKIRKGLITHLTTNLTPNQIRERYGVRIWSRIEGNFELVSLGGTSNYTDYRKLKNLKMRLPNVFYPKIIDEQTLDYYRRYDEMKANAPKYEGKPSGIGSQLRAAMDKIYGTNQNK